MNQEPRYFCVSCGQEHSTRADARDCCIPGSCVRCSTQIRAYQILCDDCEKRLKPRKENSRAHI